MAQKPNEKRDYAQTLFLYTDKSQQEIALAVGVSENTLSKWKQEGDWPTLKGAMTTTKPQLVRDLYQQISLIRESAKTEDGKVRALNYKEAQSINMLSKAVENLDSKLDAGKYVQVMEEFVNWLFQAAPKEAQNFLQYQDRFMKGKFAELNK
jgi:transposase